jgi:hypothetical protein
MIRLTERPHPVNSYSVRKIEENKMRKAVNSIFVLTLLLYVSCANKVTLPIKTSLGDLVKIENKGKVTTNKETISPKSEEVIYVLSFEGKKEFEYKEVELSKTFDLLELPLVDSKGKEFVPVFAGSPTKEGALSDDDIKTDGQATGKDGKFVATGKIILPEPRLTLVYVVPKDSSGLALKDGGQRHPIN